MTAPAVTPDALTFDRTNKWEDCKLICSAPDVVLDCGANIGQTARNLRQAYPRAEIYSFEPVASVYAQLKPVAESLGVHAVQAAVSNSTGRAEINLTESHESNSLLGYQAENNPLEKYHRVKGTEQVPTYRLDDWCREAGIDPARIHVLKMDVQGAELLALEGAASLLPHLKLILLEVAFVRYYANCPLFDDVERYMRDRGFCRAHTYASPMPDLWADATYVRVEGGD